MKVLGSADIIAECTRRNVDEMMVEVKIPKDDLANEVI